ncbi:MAG: UDP-N-acetylmuramate dehydrogenase [Oscillospiraceae bacterium]|nr:UDP-N-acetylmuramate dehydrogenase [Oscillospiraceae bacterium]MBR6616697.1 UDP-N-acetylmuramate dehydrogenase [Oscillospiraceae bacterium]
MKEQLQKLCEQYACPLETDIRLSQHTTFRIGGTADFWVDITCVQGLQALLSFCRSQKIPYFVIGKGSNILASDDGFRGVILHLGNRFSAIEVSDATITCQSGAALGAVARIAAEHSLSGMECLAGIPGTVGGALYMNAGAYGGEMKDIVVSCAYVSADGELCTMDAQEMDLSYRHSIFEENAGVIVSVTLRLVHGDQKAILEKMEELLIQRKTKQPLEYPSAGSTFKRPQGSYASLLIDQCGLKGLSVGDAQVSEKHCGFVINKGSASCADVLALCENVKQQVQEQTGYSLELEPVILG